MASSKYHTCLTFNVPTLSHTLMIINLARRGGLGLSCTLLIALHGCFQVVSLEKSMHLHA